MAEVSLIDLKWFPYTFEQLDRLSETTPDTVSVEIVKEVGDPSNPLSYYLHARSGEFEIGMKKGVGKEVMAKCTCLKYEPEKPCDHIVAVWRNIYKPKVGKYLGLLEDEVKKATEELEELLNGEKGEAVVKVEKEENRGEVKAVSDIYAKMKKELYGKLVVLFGRPMVGKTTFAMKFAKTFLNMVLLKIDKNYDAKDFGLRDDQIFEVNSPRQLLYFIDKLEPKEDMIVIVDSITSMDSFFVSEDPTKDDPRVNNRRARFCDAVLQRLQRFKQKGVVLVIAHEAIKNFRTGEIGPRMNIVALRHADVLLHATIENGRRKIKKIVKREVITEPKFDVEGF